MRIYEILHHDNVCQHMQQPGGSDTPTTEKGCKRSCGSGAPTTDDLQVLINTCVLK